MNSLVKYFVIFFLCSHSFFSQERGSVNVIKKATSNTNKSKGYKKAFSVGSQKIIYDCSKFIKNPIDTFLLPDLKMGVSQEKIINNVYWILTKLKFNDSIVGSIIPISVWNSENSIVFFDGEMVYSYLRSSDEIEFYIREGQSNGNIYYHVTKPEILVLFKVKADFDNYMLGSHVYELNYKYYDFKNHNKAVENYFILICSSVLFSFGLLFLFIFIFSKKGKYNLYFSLFSMLIAGTVLYTITGVEDYLSSSACKSFILAFLIFLIELFLLLFVKEFINYGVSKINKVMMYMFLILSIIALTFTFVNTNYFVYIMMTTIFIGAIEVVRLIIIGLFKKIKEARIVSAGLFLSICFFMYPLLSNLFSSEISMAGDVSSNSIYMSIAGAVFPVFMGISLAKDFVSNSKKLEQQISIIQNLSIENLNKEKEKQEIILKQKENLEIQVSERTKEVVEQKHLIEEKQKEIIDSINYAKRIQTALLASDRLLHDNLSDFFVLFKPKDIVAGDFYWGTSTAEGFVLVTADCTGHGVPGAFMSLLNISKLNEAINQKNILRTDLIFNDVRNEIIRALNPEGSTQESKDGMDAVICKFDFNALKLQFSAANNSFYIIRDNEILHCKADKMPVGKGHDDAFNSFTFNEIGLQKGDMIYTFTDGFADQFGGPKGKKFKYKQLEDKLIEITLLPLDKQKEQLDLCFEQWKGDLEQVDDVLIIGIRV